jgi:hypothetical protein
MTMTSEQPEWSLDIRQPATRDRFAFSRKELLAVLLLSVTFGLFTCLVSNQMLNRQHQLQGSVEMERAILRGQPFEMGKLVYVPPWQNRILFPALLELVIHVGILSAGGWYLIIRLAFSIAMFATFWVTLRLGAAASPKLASVGLLMLSYSLVMTFTNPYPISFDLPEVMFMAILVFAVLRHERLLLLVVCMVAAANRESAAFAGIIWFFLYAWGRNRKINWREAAYAALVSICSYGSALALRFAFGGMKAVQSNTQILTIKKNYDGLSYYLHHPTQLSYMVMLFCMLLPCAIWIAFNRESLALAHRRLLWAAGLMALISLFFGSLFEPRTFTPALILMIFVAVNAEARSQALVK